MVMATTAARNAVIRRPTDARPKYTRKILASSGVFRRTLISAAENFGTSLTRDTRATLSRSPTKELSSMISSDKATVDSNPLMKIGALSMITCQLKRYIVPALDC